jgi:membrane protein DedA with SNARE-associated domain
MISKTTADMSVGLSAATSPVWLQTVHWVLQEIMLLGGAVLVLLRILLALREWRKQKQPAQDTK